MDYNTTQLWVVTLKEQNKSILNLPIVLKMSTLQ